MKKQNKRSQANGDFVKILEEVVPGLAVGSNNIREGTLVSVGHKVENLQREDRIVFNTDKSIKHFTNGKMYWYCLEKDIFEIL